MSIYKADDSTYCFNVQYTNPISKRNQESINKASNLKKSLGSGGNVMKGKNGIQRKGIKYSSKSKNTK